MTDSPFLEIPPEDWIAANAEAFAIFDRFPVTEGHALVIARRLVPTWFDATPQEQSAVMQLVNVVKQHLDSSLRPRPDGYNVGFNSGDAAGQTVNHLHVHVIPRYRGDVADPRGGVRFVIPDKANYLKPTGDSAANNNNAKPQPQLSTGYPGSPLWEQLSWRIAGASQVDLLASFVQPSGLDVIEERLFDALRNGAQVRILVSDYLYISDPRALQRLVGWCAVVFEQFGEQRLHVRLIEIAKLASGPASFHPKAWHIAEKGDVFISVGSSNLSRAALQTGVEWNLLSSGSNQQPAHAQVATEFQTLWQSGSRLTPQLVTEYASAAAKYRRANFVPESFDDDEIPTPRAWQVDALAALRRLRQAGHARALVAVATGMGKTWLAAFDACQYGTENNKNRRPRVLIVAHRAHILAQAEAALSTLLDHHFAAGTTAWYIGDRSELGGELVVASVQKLSRPEGLERLAEEHFDYVVMDEVHHAHAPSYRRVLARLRCDFALGLTATPERTDGVDVATIFDDNLAYQATIGDGITEEALVPFHYVGIKDTVDFRQIPWRNGRFDAAELEQRVIRSERMDRLWSAMQSHPADRTLVFCVSRRHARFTRDWLISKGVSSAAVFSGEGSDSYGESLQRLRAGELQTLCVVDMFNEGLDIPLVDRVVMLRPTESKIIFLQQLGRGLRAAEGKTRLIVIDFVGNHRIFAQRIVHLLALRGTGDQWRSLKDWLNDKPVDLPPGCLLDVSLDAKDLLRQFLPQGRAAAIEGYRAIRDDLGRRPTALEVFTRGFLPKTICASAGSWFEFAQAEGDLNDTESEAVERFGDWLQTVEATNLNKSYKMVVLRVLLDSGNLFAGVDLYDFAKMCRRFLQSHEVLRRELEGDNHGIDHAGASDRQWADWWIRWPISRWLAAQNGTAWFTRQADTFRLNIDCPDHLRLALERLTEELVDWRLAAYAKRRRLVPTESGEMAFEAKVSHSGGRPILFIPDQKKLPGRPIGPLRAQLPNGEEWEFKLVKVACNVAAPVGEKQNQLGRLLQQWFGSSAGLPGTHFTVHFRSTAGQWRVSPASTPAALVTEPAEPADDWFVRLEDHVANSAKYTTHVPVYDLTAAAGGWSAEGVPTEIGWIAVPDQKLKKGMFAARVTGRSMQPRIPSDSWCLFRPSPAGSREGRLLLVQLNTHTDPEDGGRYTVKRYHSVKQATDDGWQHTTIEFQPLNPEYQPIRITPEDADDLRIIGEFVSVIEAQAVH